MHIALPVGAVAHLAAFEILHGLAYIVGDCASLGVGHETSRAEHTAQFAYGWHHGRLGNHHIKVQIAAFYVFHEVVIADSVGSCIAGSLRRGSLGEHCYFDFFARSCWKGHCASQHLVGFARIHAQLHRHLYGFVKLGCAGSLGDLQAFFGRVDLGAVELAGRVCVSLASFHGLWLS